MQQSLLRSPAMCLLGSPSDQLQADDKLGKVSCPLATQASLLGVYQVHLYALVLSFATKSFASRLQGICCRKLQHSLCHAAERFFSQKLSSSSYATPSFEEQARMLMQPCTFIHAALDSVSNPTEGDEDSRHVPPEVAAQVLRGHKEALLMATDKYGSAEQEHWLQLRGPQPGPGSESKPPLRTALPSAPLASWQCSEVMTYQPEDLHSRWSACTNV